MPPPGATDELQDIQQRLKAREAPQARFCWHCRKPLHARSRTCPFCGEFISARTEMDQTTRMTKYHEAESILMNDVGIIPIVFYADDVLSQTNFTGYGVTGTGLKMFWDAEKAAK